MQTSFSTVAKMWLENAGYQVVPTDIPGLFDVPGLGRDLTLCQIRDLAGRHGQPLSPSANPVSMSLRS